MDSCYVFFFQAEDGIRDDLVTGVQTCALPICPRPPGAVARMLRGDVRDVDGAVVGRVLAKPGEVVLAEGRARHDPETVLCESSDGEVALDAAHRVEHLRVDHLPDLAGNAVRAHALEKLRSALSAHLELRERGLVEEGGRLAAPGVLRPDRRRPELAGPPVWT